MGVDAEGYLFTKRPITDDERKLIQSDMRRVSEVHQDHGRLSLVGKDDCAEFSLPFGRTFRIDFGLARYYGPHYERGPWEWLSRILGFYRRHPIIEKVFYGGDCDDFGNYPEYDAAREWQIFEIWLREGETNYRGGGRLTSLDLKP